MSARDPLAAKQARAQELERLLDHTPDEATAGPLAGELHAIMDELDNVAELHPLPWVDQPADGEHHVTDATGATVYSGPDSDRVTDLQQWEPGPAVGSALFRNGPAEFRGLYAAPSPTLVLAPALSLTPRAACVTVMAGRVGVVWQSSDLTCMPSSAPVRRCRRDCSTAAPGTDRWSRQRERSPTSWWPYRVVVVTHRSERRAERTPPRLDADRARRGDYT